MQFREARPDDIPQLLELEQGVVEAERPFNRMIKSQGVRYYDLQNLISSAEALLCVVEIDAEIVGTGYVEIRTSKANYRHERHGYLGFMYVDAKHRGKGLNRQLMDRLLEWGRAQGVGDFYLEVYSKNASAIRAYEKQGFEALKVEMRLCDS